MIPETREQAELYNPQDCVKYLMHHLRQEADPNTLINRSVAEAFEKRLEFMAKDMYMKRGQSLPEEAYRQLARDAIAQYIHNYNNRPSNDKRGKHRLGMIDE